MKKIICIGNTLLTVKAIEEIRRHDTQSEIVLFCPEQCFPYDASRLSDLFSKEIDSKDLLCAPESFYKEQGVSVVMDKKVARVYLKRKRVLTEDKEQIPYDVLIIEDKGSMRFSDIKGFHKKGVFHLKTFQNVEQMRSDLSLAEVIAVEVDSLALLKMACALRKAKKEVILISPGPYLLSQCLDRDTAQAIGDLLEESGIRIVFNSGIIEVLGNGDAKAIRLKSGKVLESQMVVLAEAYRDLTLFDKKDTSIEMHKGYAQGEGVFLFEELLAQETDGKKIDELEYLELYASEHGRMIGSLAVERQGDFVKRFRIFSLNLLDATLSFIGETKPQTKTIEYVQKDSSSKVYKKMFVCDQHLLGAALINIHHPHERLQKYIQERVNIAQLPHHILDLDVELPGCHGQSQENCSCLSDTEHHQPSSDLTPMGDSVSINHATAALDQDEAKNIS